MNENQEVRSQESEADNVIALGDKIVAGAQKSSEELEKARKVMLRAFALVSGQLEHDALKLEEGAIVGNYEIKRRHEMMATANALRVTVGWIQTLVTPSDAINNKWDTQQRVPTN